ncbi:hypothetical protein [Rhodococcus sp. NPDC058521]|uniref:hypothetical protein n=1 Tax=Rhodococcus sp. NPDC058521 TaxID=3346536 RepID=UPI00365C0D1C
MIAIDSTTSTETRLRHSARRIALAVVGAVALFALYAVRPTSSPIALPQQLKPLAQSAIGLVDVTSMLVATTAIAVVAIVRTLPYGVGAVLTLSVGANLTSAAIQTWAAGSPSEILPSGHLVAVAAVLSSALLVAAKQYVPAIRGLGFVLVLGFAGASTLVQPMSPIGIVASVVIVAVWWMIASTVMLYSPSAAKREELRPDTAAIALSRRRY